MGSKCLKVIERNGKRLSYRGEVADPLFSCEVVAVSFHGLLLSLGFSYRHRIPIRLIRYPDDPSPTEPISESVVNG